MPMGITSPSLTLASICMAWTSVNERYHKLRLQQMWFLKIQAHTVFPNGATVSVGDASRGNYSNHLPMFAKVSIPSSDLFMFLASARDSLSVPLRRVVEALKLAYTVEYNKVFRTKCLAWFGETCSCGTQLRPFQTGCLHLCRGFPKTGFVYLLRHCLQSRIMTAGTINYTNSVLDGKSRRVYIRESLILCLTVLLKLVRFSKSDSSEILGLEGSSTIERQVSDM